MTTTKAFFPTAVLLAGGLLGSAVPAAAADFYLFAGQTTVTMPDMTGVPVWGFALENDGDFTTLEGTVEVPGPRLVVDPADPIINIHLFNDLTVPVSLVITGQIPSAANGPVVRFSESDPNYPAPAGTGGRIRSFAKETAPGTIETYSWPNFRNGSFIYKSGTHQQVQVPLGLYGAVTKDVSPGVAYDRPGFSVPYDSEVVLFYSEFDPALNAAVTTGNYGPGTAMPSNLNFNPQYSLVNGQPYPAAAPIVSGTLNEDSNILIRFFSAGLQSLVPTIQGDHLALVAEDGNLYPHPFNQYSVTLPAGKTIDAVLFPELAGTYPIVERRLNLTNGAAPEGGMLVQLVVDGEAGAPVAVTDAYFLDEDSALSVPGGSFVEVLGNDNDGGAPGTDPLTASLVQGPQHHDAAMVGSFSLGTDGSFSYQPMADYSGGDFFLYTVNDGASDSQPVAAVIRVDPINDPPAVVNDVYATPEDLMLSVGGTGVVGNDIDVDGDVLTASLISPPASGALTFNPGGSFSYMPDSNFFGMDSFTYEVFDAEMVSGGIGIVNLDVTAVNDPPVAVDDNAGDVFADTVSTVAAPGVLANDSDVEMTPLSAVLVRGPLNGGLTLNADGSFIYTPDPGFIGTDDFRYKANDGDLNSLEAIVSLRVITTEIFSDGFESGNSSAWSESVIEP